MSQATAERPRVCAVSYLNTTPLVWGMLHGQQRGMFDLEFRIPAACADQLAQGQADIGIVPAFELTRQDLEIIPGAGIACHGAVRSILLISTRPVETIRTLAADSSSRTSVQLARVILERKYGCRPEVLSKPPELESMLRTADAALVIGDPALRIEAARAATLFPYHCYDLGQEWVELTGLPMVFAVWAGRRGVITAKISRAFLDSLRYGRERMDEIVSIESPRREFAPDLVRDYLTRRIVHELGPREYEGMNLFLEYARGVQGAEATVSSFDPRFAGPLY